MEKSDSLEEAIQKEVKKLNSSVSPDTGATPPSEAKDQKVDEGYTDEITQEQLEKQYDEVDVENAV